MYNIVMNVNPVCGAVMRIQSLSADNLPRARDAWFSDDGSKCRVLTRLGDDCNEDYTAAISALRDHENYSCDYKCEEDETYRVFVFNTPQSIFPEVKAYAEYTASVGHGEETCGMKGMVLVMQGVSFPKLSKQNMNKMCDLYIDILKQSGIVSDEE